MLLFKGSHSAVTSRFSYHVFSLLLRRFCLLILPSSSDTAMCSSIPTAFPAMDSAPFSQSAYMSEFLMLCPMFSSFLSSGFLRSLNVTILYIFDISAKMAAIAKYGTVFLLLQQKNHFGILAEAVFEGCICLFTSGSIVGIGIN